MAPRFPAGNLKTILRRRSHRKRIEPRKERKLIQNISTLYDCNTVILPRDAETDAGSKASETTTPRPKRANRTVSEFPRQSTESNLATPKWGLESHLLERFFKPKHQSTNIVRKKNEPQGQTPRYMNMLESPESIQNSKPKLASMKSDGEV
jgi:hypothetical protein